MSGLGTNLTEKAVLHVGKCLKVMKDMKLWCGKWSSDDVENGVQMSPEQGWQKWSSQSGHGQTTFLASVPDKCIALALLMNNEYRIIRSICTTRQTATLVKSREHARQSAAAWPGHAALYASCIWWRVFNLAHAQIAHVLIVLFYVIAYTHCSAWVHKPTAWLQDCYCYLHASCQQPCIVIHSVCTCPLQSPLRHQHVSAFDWLVAIQNTAFSW